MTAKCLHPSSGLACCLLLLFFVCPSALCLAQGWDFDEETEFASSQLRYVLDVERNAAECRGFADGQSATAVTIPATVSRNGRSYNVVSIGEHAFDGAAVTTLTLSEGLRRICISAFINSQLTSVTVPASVAEIQSGAFLTNTLTEARLLSTSLQLGELIFGGGLERLYMSAATPPDLTYYLAIDTSTLQPPLVRVFVPQGSLDAYLANEYWAQLVIIDGEERSATVTTSRVGTLRDELLGQGLKLRGVNHLVVSGPLNDDDIYTVRDSLTSLFTLDMSGAVISKLPKEAFTGCRFSSIQLPGSLRDMGNSAFGNCRYLKELTIPEGVQVADHLVYNCAALRRLDLPSTLTSAKSLMIVYAIDETQTYSCIITCRSFFPPEAGSSAATVWLGNADIRLRVPAISASAYASASGWKELPQETFDEMPQSIIVAGQHELNTDGLPDGYQPNLDLVQQGNYGGYGANDAFGLLSVTGSKPLSVGTFSAYTDLYADRIWSGRYGCELLAEAPMTAQRIRLDFDLEENRWYFLSFPFDVKVSDIKTDGDIQHWVIRSYSGKNRSLMRGEQWQDVPYNATLQARQGYIWQVSTGDGESSRSNLRVTVEATGNTVNNMFERQDVSIPLSDYASTYEHNASWNLVGNPYPSYYRIGALKQTMPITVWNGDYGYSQYRTLSPLDDAGKELHPYEAFFLQKPAEADVLVFGAEGRVAFGSSNARAGESGSIPTGSARQLLNLTLTVNGMTDHARVVLNPEAKPTYERERDAAKFFSSSEAVPQLYTFIGSEPCAINERPLADGTVSLGIRTGSAQSCTIALDEPVQGVVLEDRLTGTLTDLSAEAYTFTSRAGRDDSRFVLHAGGSATGISQTPTAKLPVPKAACTLQGQPVGSSYKGIVIENGKLTIKR